MERNYQITTKVIYKADLGDVIKELVGHTVVVSGLEGHTFAIGRPRGGRFVLTETKTGRLVGAGWTKKKAFEDADEWLKGKTEGCISEFIKSTASEWEEGKIYYEAILRRLTEEAERINSRIESWKRFLDARYRMAPPFDAKEKAPPCGDASRSLANQ